MLGKDICKIARAMRKQIASENGIVYLESECNKLGDCNGYCSITEAETRWLNHEIQNNIESGKGFIFPDFKFYSTRTDIKYLNLGKKTMRVLKEVGINTIEQLQELDVEDLYSIPNIKEMQVLHIMEQLDQYEALQEFGLEDLPF